MTIGCSAHLHGTIASVEVAGTRVETLLYLCFSCGCSFLISSLSETNSFLEVG